MAAAIDATNSAPLRWGILSTAAITRKNAAAMVLSRRAGLVAVASRDAARAASWARELEGIMRDAAAKVAGGADVGAVRSYGSYEELLADAEVDAVYIPLPAAMHLEWVRKCAAAKKHVLVEKPCGASLEEVATCVRVCAEAGVQWMDGVMFNHHARLPAIRAYLDDAAAMGAVRRVVSGFSFMGDAEFFTTNIRMDPAVEPFGALGDLGWYNIRLALWVFNGEMPTHVRCISHEVPTDVTAGVSARVPVECSATLVFTGGRVSTFDCSFTHGFRQWAEIVGTRGRITYDDFCISRSHDSACFNVHTHAGLTDNHSCVAETSKRVEILHCVQEAEMFASFAAAVASGGRERSWPQWSLKTQSVLDACMASARDGGALVEVPPLPTVY